MQRSDGTLMQYLGGKASAGPALAAIIDRYRSPGSLFMDVFCGALNVVRHVQGHRVANDACRPLITMWHAALEGWVPPSTVSRELYDRIKASPEENDPLTAFVLFGCSYGGKWAAGYAKDRPQQRYAECAANGVRKKARACRDVELSCLDYRDLQGMPEGAVLYCDPPYEGTTTYGAVGKFSSKEFWSWATAQAERGCLVFVSEGYGGARGWVPFQTLCRGPGRGGLGGKRVMIDRLYVHTSSPMAREQKPLGNPLTMV